MDQDMGPELSPEAINLQLEANAALAGLPPEPPPIGAPAAPPAMDPETEFREVLRLPVMFVQNAVLPQWGITDEFREEWNTALAQCLTQLFPDGINGKYACWFRLLACSGVIVVNALATNGGKLPGLGPKRPDPEPEGGAVAPAG